MAFERNDGSALTFNVAQLLKNRVGAERQYEILVQGQPFIEDLSLQKPLKGYVRLIHTADGVLVISKLDTAVELTCDRCLGAFIAPIDFQLEEEFLSKIDIRNDTVRSIEELDNYEEDLLIDEHHILDLREIVRQHLLLALPIHPICKVNCAGLCSQCGKNLNEGSCDCEPELDPRWAVLSTWADISEQTAEI